MPRAALGDSPSVQTTEQGGTQLQCGSRRPRA